MKLSFRVECPHCKWGYSPSANNVNQGFLKGKCHHCEKEFFFKITVMGVNVEVTKELPAGIPCAPAIIGN